MSRRHTAVLPERLAALLQGATSQQLAAFRGRATEACSFLRDIDHDGAATSYIELLTQFETVAAEIAGSSEGYHGGDRGGGDHGYGSFLKLCRSVRFHWGPWTKPSDAQAFAPHVWALSEILAETAPTSQWNLLEIGCGTGGFAQALLAARPKMRMTLFDPAAESLAIALALLCGQQLKLPFRTDFAENPDGITWFDIDTPAQDTALEFSLAMPQVRDFDCVVAINALSLAPDPHKAVHEAIRALAPGGLFVWLDLCSWRVETPRPRRIRGLAGMAELCTDHGMEIVKRVSGIPYIEDWGFERNYNWRDHLIVARRPGTP